MRSVSFCTFFVLLLCCLLEAAFFGFVFHYVYCLFCFVSVLLPLSSVASLLSSWTETQDQSQHQTWHCSVALTSLSDKTVLVGLARGSQQVTQSLVHTVQGIVAISLHVLGVKHQVTYSLHALTSCWGEDFFCFLFSLISLQRSFHFCANLKGTYLTCMASASTTLWKSFTVKWFFYYYFFFFFFFSRSRGYMTPHNWKQPFLPFPFQLFPPPPHSLAHPPPPQVICSLCPSWC